MLRSVLLLVVAATTISNAALWTELGTLDCNAHVHFANQNGFLSSDANLFSKLFVWYADFLVDNLRNQAKCHCPDLTQDNLDKNFSPSIELLLRAFAEDSAFPLPSACNSSATPQNKIEFWFDQLNEKLILDLPSTCSLATWQSTGKCELQWPVPDLDMTLQFSLHRCNQHLPAARGSVPLRSESAVPFVSVSCKGDTCQDLWKFCDSDADCAGSHTCDPMRVQEREVAYQLCRRQHWCLNPENTNECSCQGNRPASDPFADCFCFDQNNPSQCTGEEKRCYTIEDEFGNPIWYSNENDAWQYRDDNDLYQWSLEELDESFIGVQINDRLNDAFLDIIQGPPWFNNSADTCPLFGSEVGWGVANRLFSFFSNAWRGDDTQESGMRFCGLKKFGLSLEDEEMPRTNVRHEIENPFKLRGCGLDNPSLEALCPCRFNESLRHEGPCACDYDQPCPRECSSDYFWQTCTGSPFDAWAGNMEDGLGAASAPNRRDGTYFTEFENVPQGPNELVLIRHSCEEQFSLFPNNDISARVNFPDFPSLADHIGGIVKDLAKCRDPSIDGNDDLFSALNWPVDSTFLLHLLTEGQGWVDLGADGKTYETLYSKAKRDLDANSEYRPAKPDDPGTPWDDSEPEKLGIKFPEMPATCTLSNWIQNRECGIEWDGFSELLYGDVGSITLRLETKQCAEHPLGFPELTLSCVGSKCRETFEFWRLDYCQVDNDCQSPSSGAERKCNDFSFDIVHGQNNLLWRVFGERRDSSKFNLRLDPSLDSTGRNSVEAGLSGDIFNLVLQRGSQCSGFTASRMEISVVPYESDYSAIVVVKPELPDADPYCGDYEVEHALQNLFYEKKSWLDCGADPQHCGPDPTDSYPSLAKLDYYREFWVDYGADECFSSGCPSDDSEFQCGRWRDCKQWEFCDDNGQWALPGECPLSDQCVNYDTMMQDVLDFVGIVTGRSPSSAGSCPDNLNCHGVCDPYIVALANEVTEQESDSWVDKYFRTPDKQKVTVNHLQSIGVTVTQTEAPTTPPPETGPGGSTLPPAASTTLPPMSAAEQIHWLSALALGAIMAAAA